MGTGMHGGQILLGGNIEDYQLGREVGASEVTDEDRERINPHLTDYCAEFDLDPDEIVNRPFVKLSPVSARPYGRIYVY
jgi:glutamate synthase domain-containing protein 3